MQRKKWFKLSLIIISFALASATIYLILHACGITNLNTLKAIINRSNNFSMIVCFLIEIAVFVLFSFVPIMNEAIVILASTLFGSWTAFIISWIANIVATSLLFLIGDKFGEHLAVKLVGKEDFDKAQDIIDNKSKFYLPLLFLTPGFPDEALCIVAGMTKMKYWYLLSISAFTHFIECAVLVFFGGGFIIWSALSVFDWIIFINLIIIDLYLFYKIQKHLEKRNKK